MRGIEYHRESQDREDEEGEEDRIVRLNSLPNYPLLFHCSFVCPSAQAHGKEEEMIWTGLVQLT